MVVMINQTAPIYCDGPKKEVLELNSVLLTLFPRIIGFYSKGFILLQILLK